MTFALFVRVLPSLVGLVIQFIQLVKTKGIGTPEVIGQVSAALAELVKAKSHEDHEAAAKSLALALAGKPK